MFLQKIALDNKPKAMATYANFYSCCLFMLLIFYFSTVVFNLYIFFLEIFLIIKIVWISFLTVWHHFYALDWIFYLFFILFLRFYLFREPSSAEKKAALTAMRKMELVQKTLAERYSLLILGLESKDTHHMGCGRFLTNQF